MCVVSMWTFARFICLFPQAPLHRVPESNDIFTNYLKLRIIPEESILKYISTLWGKINVRLPPYYIILLLCWADLYFASGLETTRLDTSIFQISFWFKSFFHLFSPQSIIHYWFPLILYGLLILASTCLAA